MLTGYLLYVIYGYALLGILYLFSDSVYTLRVLDKMLVEL